MNSICKLTSFYFKKNQFLYSFIFTKKKEKVKEKEK